MTAVIQTILDNISASNIPTGKIISGGRIHGVQVMRKKKGTGEMSKD
ncbi:MAG: hypothetical protein NTZ24_04000 [Deltaproteobacteria bacterium]|nr:hypothetical protein [Deltaproteobacteria bacterium]